MTDKKRIPLNESRGRVAKPNNIKPQNSTGKSQGSSDSSTTSQRVSPPKKNK